MNQLGVNMNYDEFHTLFLMEMPRRINGGNLFGAITLMEWRLANYPLQELFVNIGMRN